MLIQDRSQIFLRFASPVTLEFSAVNVEGDYVFGADTDLDVTNACCVEATATAADGKLVFVPKMDLSAFYNKVQQGGLRSGTWEIRHIASCLCVAFGTVSFAPGTVVPGYTPSDEAPISAFATMQYVNEEVNGLQTELKPAIDAIGENVTLIQGDMSALKDCWGDYLAKYEAMLDGNFEEV